MQETISVNQLTVCSTTYCIHWKAASFNRAHWLGRPKGRPGIFIVSDDSLYDRRAFSNSSRDSWKRLCIRRNSLECHRQGPTNKPHPVSCSFQSKKWTFDRLFARPYTHLQCRLPGLLIIYGDDVSRQKKNFFFSPDEEMMRAKHLSTATALRKKVKESWRGFPSFFLWLCLLQQQQTERRTRINIVVAEIHIQPLVAAPNLSANTEETSWLLFLTRFLAMNFSINVLQVVVLEQRGKKFNPIVFGGC